MGSGILTILLGAAGYDGTLAVQSASAMAMIRFLYLWTPVVLAVVTIVIMCAIVWISGMTLWSPTCSGGCSGRGCLIGTEPGTPCGR